MITIPFIILFTLLAYFKGAFIRKHNTVLYIIALLFAIATFITRYKIPLTEPFTQGYLGLSLLYIVMMAGALQNTMKLRKRIMGVRREYSIIGFILLTPHALKYLIEFLQGTIRFEWFGVIPFAIMIPLFITSFMVVRKKMTQKAWKKLQQFAYIAYILIFVHLIVVAKMPNLIVYIVLFTPYIIMKPLKEFKLYKSNTTK